MPYVHPDALVETDWLSDNLANVKVLDGSWYLPAQNRDPVAEYAAGHIPGAQFFDIDAIADPDTDLPHMLPTAEDFAKAVGAMGISNKDRVVVYDGIGLQSAARVWWEFRAFGHANVALLNGGLPKWQAEDRPLETTTPVPKPATFAAKRDATILRTADQLLANVESRAEQVLDVRPKGRFDGTDAEPRPGVRSGHIPGAKHLVYTDILNPDRTLKDADALRAALTGSGIDLNGTVVTSCGSGITASVMALGLHLIGHDKWAVYDGSWTEWGGRTDTPIDT
ncbi:MAG: 3-mercaptopyruvate sulfurtransferase [Proteobacteria bacterium]|nr:3-mercaptopyruvate sulfurtransferase [Pseudomonadota bacterium]MDA1058866.1 3-mercaptopyruvate sulfurtransferase [Pseudomonadota bacterium]